MADRQRNPGAATAPTSLALVALVGLAGACEPPFDPATYLTGLRLLATRAEPAEPAAGELVTMTALIVDTNDPAGDRATVEWRWCTLSVNAASTVRVNPDCLGEGPFLRPLGSGRTISFPMPDVDVATLGLPDTTLGFYLPIRVTVRAPDAEGRERTIDGIYRLRLHPRQSPLPRNRNPELAGLWLVREDLPLDGGGLREPTVDGGTAIPDAGVGVGPGTVELVEGMAQPPFFSKGWLLRALYADGAIERYTTITTDPTTEPMLVEKSETLTVRWFATAGEVFTPVSGLEIADSWLAVEYKVNGKARVPAPGETIDVYAVGHDERGGTSWLHRQLLAPFTP